MIKVNEMSNVATAPLPGEVAALAERLGKRVQYLQRQQEKLWAQNEQIAGRLAAARQDLEFLGLLAEKRAGGMADG